MSPKRGDRAAPPPVGNEFDLRFANTEAANGWDHLSRHAAGAAARLRQQSECREVTRAHHTEVAAVQGGDVDRADGGEPGH